MNRTIDPFQRVIADFATVTEQITSDGKNAEEEETIQMIEASIARFGERLVDPARIDAEQRIPPEVLSAAAEMGLYGLTIDPAFGGAGLSMKAACRLMQALGQVNGSVGVSIGLHNGLGLRGLNRLGNPALQARYLPDLAAGKLIGCFAATESDAGSDIASLRTTAIADGSDLVINGSKIFVTNGGFAGLATIVARTPGLAGSSRGHSLILVPLHLPGVHRDKEEHKLGIKGSSTCSLHFEDVRVGQDHLIGTPSRGLDQMGQILSWGRTFMAAGCIGAARSALKKTLEQVTTRRQFHRPIGEFGMVREKVANMRSRLHAMESIIRLVTNLEDQQPESIAWESSLAKVFCSEGAWQAADDAVQLHGGSGFIEETGVARTLRDIRITRIFEGANEVLRFHVASAVFAWDLSRMVEAVPLHPLLDDSLAREGRVFDDLRREMAEALAGQKKQFGLKIFKRQMAQRRVADMACGLYVILSVLARAQGEIEKGRADSSLPLWTEHVVHDMGHLVKRSIGELADNADELSSQIAAAECARIGCPLEEATA